jgi:hypothetical protein
VNIVGITFNKELKEYVAVKAIKISKWIDLKDFSLDVIFRLTIEHKYRENKFTKIKELYVYFQKEDLENITIELDIIKLERKRLEESQSEKSKEHELEEKISPLKGYIYPILTKGVIVEDDGGKKRIKIALEDYTITEWTKKRNILFSLRFKKSIISFYNPESGILKTPWSYDCLIEPYLVQILKWDKKEFMPLLESLEVWLQIPKELYGSVSAVYVQPESHFEQMFLLGNEIAERFRKAGQPLAQEETLCINWAFDNVSVSSPLQRIEVTYRPKQSELEVDIVRRFEETSENPILILREILHVCKIHTLDFNYIISGVSEKNLKKVLEVFNAMVFQKNWRPMKENLDLLVILLEGFKKLPHGEEFFSRYSIFQTLINCEKSENFFSDDVYSKLSHAQELEDVLDPNYVVLVRDFNALAELTEKSQYEEVLSRIDKLSDKWDRELVHSDRQILFKILANWKHIIEEEYGEKKVPKPEIQAIIKTKHVSLADEVGIVVSVRNIGEGKARDVWVKLIQSNDYEIVTKRSETKAFLDIIGKPFEPELVIKPKNATKAAFLYEIHYKDLMGKSAKKRFQELIEFMEVNILFQKIQNPYIIGEVVRESKIFFGREELIQNIIDTFKGKYATNPIFLYGQRRTGKTSILFHLKERLKDDFAPVFFTTLEIFGKKSFYNDLMERVKKELGFKDIEIPSIDDDPFNGFKDRFYAKLMERLSGKKIVLMIDEYQRIDELITEGYYNESVIDFLNAVVQYGEIKIILAGYLSPEELHNIKWMELMRFFTKMNVSLLNKENTVELICEPVEEVMKYDEAGIEKIISLSGCHPYFVQLICHTMVEHHNYDRINLVGYNHIANCLFDYFEKGYNVFCDILSTQTQEMERRILLCLCKLMEEKSVTSVHKSEIEKYLAEHSRKTDAPDIERALSHLERREIVRKSAEHPEYYEFTIDLYRHWIKWNLSEQ